MEFSKIHILLISLFSCFLSIIFFLLIEPNLQSDIYSFRKEFSVKKQSFEKEILLAGKINYFIKIKYFAKRGDMQSVSLNGNKLELKFSNVSKSKLLTSYYNVPKDFVNADKNTVSIRFLGTRPNSVDFEIANYITSLGNNNIIMTLKDSGFKNNRKISSRFICCVIFSLFTIAVWYLLLWISGFSMIGLINNFLAYSGVAFIFGVFAGISFKGPYILLIDPIYMLLIMISFIGIFHLFFSLSYLFLSSSILVEKKKTSDESKPFLFEKKIIIRFKSVQLSRKFILIFIIFFLLGGLLLIAGLNYYARFLVNISFFFLISGILAQMARVLRKK